MIEAGEEALWCAEARAVSVAICFDSGCWEWAGEKYAYATPIPPSPLVNFKTFFNK